MGGEKEIKVLWSTLENSFFGENLYFSRSLNKPQENAILI